MPGILAKIAADHVVEVPHTFHPVVVQPPQVRRKEFPFTGFIDFQGLKIDVENKAGSFREGKDKDGKPWRIEMRAGAYGEIRDTTGTDGDNLDCYVGPNHDSSIVVVIRQHKPENGAFDEDKVMLGYDSVEHAIGAYKLQYNRPGFYKDGDYLAMPIGKFWRWVHDRKNEGKKVASAFAGINKAAAGINLNPFTRWRTPAAAATPAWSAPRPAIGQLPPSPGPLKKGILETIGEHAPKAGKVLLGGAVVGGGLYAAHKMMQAGKNQQVEMPTKAAEHVPTPQDPQALLQIAQPVLICLLALYQLYYFAHWTAKGQSSYSDHQLFERLYKSTQEEYDKLAERLVGLVGPEAVDGVFTLAAAKNEFWVKECGQGDVLCAAQNGESETQAVLASAYRELDTHMALTLGLDETIMSLASQHETNAYLLKQRAGAPAPKTAGVLSSLAR